MIIYIDIDQKTKDCLDELVTSGKYRDYSEAASVALLNQLLLERAGQANKPSGAIGTENSKSTARDSSMSMTKLSNSTGRRPPAMFSIPEPGAQLEAAPIPSDVFVPNASVPVDRWIFGQHNKLLPAKASCRGLAFLCTKNKNVPVTKAASEIASASVELGDFLREFDEKHGLSRDSSVSIGFPHSGSETGDKARLRYANQFVGSLNKHGQLTGLLVDLKLINSIKGKEIRIQLTKPGLEFMKLCNPVLDANGKDLQGGKFSEEEKSFLMDHILKHVPAEYSAYRTVIRALMDGANIPEKLDVVLSQLLSKRQGKPFTKAYVATQRSGVISRMSDLELIRKERDGIRVMYHATDLAVNYVKF